MAASGPQLVYEHTILPQSPLGLLVVALALALVRVTRGDGHRFALLASFVLGTAILVKPVAQVLVPFALLFAALRLGTRGQRLASVGALTLALVLTIGPWTLRNLAVHGRFSAGGVLGDSLLARTAAHSRGQFSFAEPDLPGADSTELVARRIIQAGIAERSTATQIRRQLRAELGLTDLQLDPLLQRLALDAIRRQPLTYLESVSESARQLYSWREPGAFTALWQPRPLLDNPEQAARLLNRPTPPSGLERARVRALLNLYQPANYGLELPLLAVFGLVSVWWLRPSSTILVPAVLAFVLLMAHLLLNGPVTRYRYVIEPLVNVLALGGVWIVLLMEGRLVMTAVRRLATLLLARQAAARSAAGQADGGRAPLGEAPRQGR